MEMKAHLETNLKRIRTDCRYSQRELAERSGVSLRSIQMYEQRKKDINKAQSESLYYLARTLSCKMEDLLEKCNKPRIEVVAALIWNEDKFLICQRPADKARGLLWEFVGGKVESGETKEQALIRECREELAITVEPQEIFAEVTHEYFDITVHLTLFDCAVLQGQPQLLEHNDMKWITPAEIPSYGFCPADVEILKKIQQRG